MRAEIYAAALALGWLGVGGGLEEGAGTRSEPVDDAGGAGDVDAGPDLPEPEVCEALCEHVYDECGLEFPRDRRMPANGEACYNDCLYGWFGGAESCLTEASCGRREVLRCVRETSPGEEIGEPCEEGTEWPSAWAEFEQRVVELTNERRAEGATCDGEEFDPAPPVESNPELRCAARRHSFEMAEREYFAHDSPEGEGPSDRAADAGYEFLAVGENIARGRPTPEGVVEGWMESPGHCRNIMRSNYQEIGVGYVEDIGTIYQHVATQVFGSPQ